MYNKFMVHYKKLEEKKISSKQIWRGILGFNYDTVRLINGKTATREYIVHPGASAVLAVKDGKVVMVQQYRYPVQKVLWEIPAGKIEKGQTPLSCAKVELEQETGYKAGRIKKMLSFHPAPAFSDEELHIFYAGDLKKGKLNRDKDEFLNVKEFPLKEILKMIHSGKIKDAKTLIALSLYENEICKKK